MTNSTKRDYKIKHTELFGGDIQLQQSQNCSSGYLTCCCYSSDETPKIESQGELSGLYFYSIDQSFVLVQQSTFSLPFVKTNIKLEKYFSLTNYFQEQTQKGKFKRKYQIQSDSFLPKGIVTVREDGRVVGQAQLLDLSKDQKQDLDCGNDPDVTFIRDINILSQKRHSASYFIRLTIKNSKSKSIKYEYKEIFSSSKFTINPKNVNEQLNNQIQSTHEGMTIIEEHFKSNDEQIFQYEISLEYQNNQPDDKTS
jgi:hypothetical protein